MIGVGSNGLTLLPLESHASHVGGIGLFRDYYDVAKPACSISVGYFFFSWPNPVQITQRRISLRSWCTWEPGVPSVRIFKTPHGWFVSCAASIATALAAVSRCCLHRGERRGDGLALIRRVGEYDKLLSISLVRPALLRIPLAAESAVASSHFAGEAPFRQPCSGCQVLLNNFIHSWGGRLWSAFLKGTVVEGCSPALFGHASNAIHFTKRDDGVGLGVDLVLLKIVEQLLSFSPRASGSHTATNILMASFGPLYLLVSDLSLSSTIIVKTVCHPRYVTSISSSVNRCCNNQQLSLQLVLVT